MAGSLCSFNYPKRQCSESLFLELCGKIKIKLKIFGRGVNAVEKFCGTMVENSFKEHAERRKHSGM